MTIVPDADVGGGTAPHGRGWVRLAPAAGVYVAWVVATYLLEGYPRTLVRPEAGGLRAAYAVVANLAVGMVGGTWVARGLVHHAGASPDRLGFRRPARALAATAAGLSLGLLAFALLGPPGVGRLTLVNLFAQAAVVSAAEVVVCWAVVGGAVEHLLRPAGRWVAAAGAVAAASAAFGAYHLAHSPPFNSPGMVAFLTGVGVLTGLVFLASRDVYGTIAFHNGLALVGLAEATRAAGPDGRLHAPLVVTAVAAVAVLAACHRLWLRPRPHTGRAG